MTCDTLLADIAAAFLTTLDYGMYSGALLFAAGYVFARIPAWLDRYFVWRSCRP